MGPFDWRKSRFEKAEESPGLLLWQVGSQWRRSIEKTLEPFDLTHPQFVALASVAWVGRSGLPTSQADVARHMKLDVNTVSQILRSLEEKGLIERKRTPDERVRSPVLTESGVERLGQSLPAVETADRLFFDPLERSLPDLVRSLRMLLREH